LKKYDRAVRFFTSFFLFSLLLTGLFFLMTMKSGQTEQAGTVSEVTVFEESDSLRVLLIGLSDDKKPHSFLLLHVDAPVLRVHITELANTDYSYQNKSFSLPELYTYGSVVAVRQTVESSLNCTIDRTVRMTDSQTVAAIDALGGFEYHVQNDLRYDRDGHSLRLYRGTQKIMGQQALLLMEVLEEQGAENVREELLGALINTRIHKIKSPAGSLFVTLINLMDTDIGVMDKDRYRALLQALAQTETPAG